MAMKTVLTGTHESEVGAALARLLRAVDALHVSDLVVRELVRAGLAEELAAAAREACGALDAEAC
jgi:hypothetical protein